MLPECPINLPTYSLQTSENPKINLPVSIPVHPHMTKNLLLPLICILTLSACSPEKKYDKKTAQKPVRSHAGIDSLLNSLETVKYEDLNPEYLTYSRSTEAPFQKNLKNRTYHIVKGDKIYAFVAHEYRLKDFLCHDHYYARNRKDLKGGHEQYWLTDAKLLYRFLDLLEALEEAGHDPAALTVKCSHRHPAYNAEINGASRSQHLWGRAIDMRVGDVDGSGGYTEADKKIVLELLENEVIANTGGVGRYPGTRSVHMDVRGWGARWDQQ